MIFWDTLCGGVSLYIQLLIPMPVTALIVCKDSCFLTCLRHLELYLIGSNKAVSQ